MNRSARQKQNREITELTEFMAHMNLSDIYRTFHPNIKEYTFFSTPHGTFFKTDHILGHKASLNRYKKKLNNPLYFIRPLWIKARVQQQS